MKSRRWSGALCLGIGLWLVGIALAGTSDVFRVSGTINGVIQRGVTGKDAIHKIKISRDDLINLARGRELGSTVPKNEELALSSQCLTNNMKLIVFDLVTESNLATVAQLDPVETVFTDNRKEMIAQFTVPGAGNSTNGLAGGAILIDAKFNVHTNDCVTKWSGTILGVLDTLLPATNQTVVFQTNFVGMVTNVVTNTVATLGGTNVNVIISKATFKTQGKKLGTLIEVP